jgi:hypothetical protein
MRPYWKKTKAKKGWDVSQMVELLLSKWNVLRSNPSTAKKKKMMC